MSECEVTPDPGEVPEVKPEPEPEQHEGAEEGEEGGEGEGEGEGVVVVTEPEAVGVSSEEFPEPESEEASPVQHNSSGYASDGSGAGGSNNSSDAVQCPDFVQQQQQASSIQSDPGQSAFRPALPGGVAQYPGLDGEYQYRQGGAAWGETGEMYGPPLGLMTQAGPHHMTPHHQMHQPIARRPITGNMSGYPPNPASYGGMGGRPGHQQGHFPSSPGPGPHNNQQYRQATAYSGASWASPSWSGNGGPPPSGPPPMSMTPPPLSWNQANNRRPQSGHFPQQNKPFGNIQTNYGGNQPQMMQHQIRSKNYPFPTKTLNQDCVDDGYGGGRGPLDNMRTLEHYLPDHQNQSKGLGEDKDMVGGFGPDGSSTGFYGSSRSSPRSHSSQNYDSDKERFSRKVFVGGLPPDIDEDEITASFRRFGPLVVDWPHKAESKSYFPPKGYAFLLFQDESSVQQLIEACIQDEDKLYLCVSSPTIKDKPVQIRPWKLSDADFVLDATLPLDPRKTVFVGGVPRPLKAVELAMIMDRLYGGVCYAGIDTDPELRYPKGAGRVAFSNQQSYIAAISARFVQLQHGEIDKRVEVKPYVLDDQLCDECQGGRCGGKFAPFFCANVTCLQYYCEQCWSSIHSRPGREFHKPLVKEGADRPRAVPFRWC